MTDDINVKIAAYIAGSLSSEELKKFEEAMANDADLREEVALERELYLHLNGNVAGVAPPENDYAKSMKTFMHSKEAEELNTKLLNARDQYRNKKRQRRSFSVLWAAAVITAILIAANGLLFKSAPTSAELYDQYYRTEDLPSFTKRDVHTSVLLDAIMLFNQSKFEESILLFNGYMKENEQANVSNYIYLGLAYTALEDQENAVAAFDKLINSNSIDRSKGLWFKALSYLKLGKPDKARAALEKLIEKKNFNYKDAEKLLDEL